MKRFVIVMVSLMVCAWSFSPAMGAMDERNIAKLAKWLKTGKGFRYTGSIPSDQRQLLIIKLGYGLKYLSDFKTRLCYLWDDRPVEKFDCDIIKKGYPLVAPLIYW